MMNTHTNERTGAHRRAHRGGGAWFVLAASGLALTGASAQAPRSDKAEMVVIAYNDLGMHCMDDDFSELVILPPFNTLRAMVIRRGESPEIITEAEDTSVRYSIPTNTHSDDKTNFWRYAPDLFGVSLPPDVGLAGFGLSGAMMRPPGEPYWHAVGIPVTPIDDTGRSNPYPLARIDVTHTQLGAATTVAVVPVSDEIRCSLCHADAAGGANIDILEDHDALHGTNLIAQQPVLCAGCHADPALGTPGTPGVPMLSHAMHSAHASRMNLIPLDNECYACHPGVRTDCQRDVHRAAGIECVDCHDGMEALGDPSRTPWLDQPRCGDCHTKAGFEFEEPGVLFKDSVGHGGVLCSVCHNSPHTIAPALTDADNEQMILHQGYPGTLNDCVVCHVSQPTDPFPHRREDR